MSNVNQNKKKLFGKTYEELIDITQKFQLPEYSASQIASWLYKKNISSINQMTNLKKEKRILLSEEYELGIDPPIKFELSKDGTKKYLFPASGNRFIETAMIPENKRKTVCLSSQIGCKMGCDFCMTAKQGFQGQLTSGEIINQIHSIEESDQITNIVYMGMGEPFDNLEEVLKSLKILTSDWGYAMSPKRITVSSIGIIPGLIRFLNESDTHLAISLHSPFDDERQKLMPVQTAYPISKVLQYIRKMNLGPQRRISFEYIMFKGLNDTRKHIIGLSKLLNGIKCRINLIRFHPIPGSNFVSSDENTIQDFKESLNKKGLLTTIRDSRGLDISAACGLLSTKELMNKQ